MGFNKKLIVAGLAVGVTAYMLYKASKKHQQSQPTPTTTMSSSHQPNSNSTSWGAAAIGGATVAVAGTAYAHHHHNQQQLNPNSNPTTNPTVAATNPNLGWDSLRDWKHIANLLATCVMDQFLYPFYTFSDVVRIAQQIASSGALAQCADSWQLPPYLAQDLVKLALFDVMFLLDDSASMRSEGSRRRDALAGILKRAADAAARFDPDGMEVAWMNSSTQQRIHNVQEADQLTLTCAYDGRATPMGTSLESKILQPLVLTRALENRLQKPALVLIITDGRPTGSCEKHEKIVKVLQHAKSTLSSTRYGADAVSFQIAAVGNDREAQDWLDSIDNHPNVGDLIDVCSDIAVESAQVKKSTGIQLSQELYCLKLLLGPIDTSYDASDENEKDTSSDRRAMRKRHKREQEKREKEARFRGHIESFRKEREALLHGATPVPSAGGTLPPVLGAEADLSGYSHQTNYPAPFQQSAGYPQSTAYPQPGAGYQQHPQQPQAPYPPPQSSYGQAPPPGPGTAYPAPAPAPGSGSGSGYPTPQTAPGYQPYGSTPAAAPPPYPDPYQSQAYGQRDVAPPPEGSTYPPAPSTGGFAGGFAMPTPHIASNDATSNLSYPPLQAQQYQQPQQNQPPFGFPQPRPSGY